MKKIVSIVLALCLFVIPVFSERKSLSEIEKYKTKHLIYALSSLGLSIGGLATKSTYGFVGGVISFYFFTDNTIKSVYSYKQYLANDLLELIYDDGNIQIYNRLDRNLLKIFYDEETKSLMFRPNENRK